MHQRKRGAQIDFAPFSKGVGAGAEGVVDIHTLPVFARPHGNGEFHGLSRGQGICLLLKAGVLFAPQAVLIFSVVPAQPEIVGVDEFLILAVVGDHYAQGIYRLAGRGLYVRYGHPEGPARVGATQGADAVGAVDGEGGVELKQRFFAYPVQAGGIIVHFAVQGREEFERAAFVDHQAYSQEDVHVGEVERLPCTALVFVEPVLQSGGVVACICIVQHDADVGYGVGVDGRVCHEFDGFAGQSCRRQGQVSGTEMIVIGLDTDGRVRAQGVLMYRGV